MDPEKNARLSVRRAMPGMVNVEKSAATGIVAGPQVKKLLRNASTNKGCVKVQIKELVMVGKAVGSQNLVQREWESKFDGLEKFLEEGEPSYLAFWRDDKDCLLVSFIPDNIKPRDKMLYASTRGALKEAIHEIDPEGAIEEYNVNEIKDVSSEKYLSRTNIPKPYTDYEKEKMEEEKAEIGGGYGFLAHLMKVQKDEESPKPVALPGLGAAAAAIAKGKKDGRLDIKDAVKQVEKAKKEEEASRKVEMAKEVAEVEKSSRKVEVAKEVAEVEKEAVLNDGKMEDAEQEKDDDRKDDVETEKEKTEESEPKKEEEVGLSEVKADEKKEETEDEQTKEDLEIEVQEEIKSLEKIVASDEEKSKPEEKPQELKIEKSAKPKEEKKAEPAAISNVVPPLKSDKKESTMKSLKNSYKFFKDKVMMGKGKEKEKGQKKSTAISEEELAKYADDDGRHTLSELQAKVKAKDFGDLDKDKIEQYLSSREFFQTFNVEKTAFDDLPVWKKKRLKESAQLF